MIICRVVQKSGHPIYFWYNFSKSTPILTKTIYAFYWLKYLLTYSQQWIVTSLLRHICVFVDISQTNISETNVIALR